MADFTRLLARAWRRSLLMRPLVYTLLLVTASLFPLQLEEFGCAVEGSLLLAGQIRHRWL